MVATEPGKPPINLSIGEPRHGTPNFVKTVLADTWQDFGRYPPIRGTSSWRQAVTNWLEKRYSLDGIIDPDKHVLPLCGTREGLFYAALAAHSWLPKPDAPTFTFLPSPFYQVYASSSSFTGAEIKYYDAPASNGFIPKFESIPKKWLNQTQVFYIASPSNPQGAVLALDHWKELIELSLEHNFMIFADECYSEIYRNTPPPGILEASSQLGTGFRNMITFHSLSKRSNLPGLRSGFVAGDPDFLSEWTGFRNVAAPQVPLPAQKIAETALGDETHVIENRRLYNEKFDCAKQILNSLIRFEIPQGGFFLWLDISAIMSVEKAAISLWKEQGIRVIPGSYLARPDEKGTNPGDAFIRIALVGSLEETQTAMNRLASWINIHDRKETQID